MEESLGNYKLLHTLGKGTFGEVRVAKHVLTAELVAVKVLDKAKIEDEDDEERLRREIEMLRKCRHPNICQLYQILQTQKAIYMVMEYCQEGELFNYIVKCQRLSEKVASRMLNQILNALQYLRTQGISHRDLKPENLLLDFNYNIKLIDFGLSNYFNDKLLQTSCGSPCYASPQMISGEPYNGFITDLWSLGVVLYVMLCGYLPFEEETTKQLYSKIKAGFYKKLPSFLKPATVQLIKGLLEVKAQSRISLQKIRENPFCKNTFDLQPRIKGILVGQDAMPIDFDLVNETLNFKQFTLEKEIGYRMIRQNRHNAFTAAYYLLQKRILKEGGKTVVDLQIFLQKQIKRKASPAKTPVKQRTVTRNTSNSKKVRNRSKSIEDSLRKTIPRKKDQSLRQPKKIIPLFELLKTQTQAKTLKLPTSARISNERQSLQRHKLAKIYLNRKKGKTRSVTCASQRSKGS